MAYVEGEWKITKTVEDAKQINDVYDTIAKTDKTAYGSTRFNSHGYICGLKTVDLSKIQRNFPAIEFKISHNPISLVVCFRTKGSTGWHGTY